MRFRFILYPLFILIFIANIYPQELSYWKKLSSPTSYLLNKLFFIDSSLGWIGGEEGTILGTTDGGESWSLLYSARITYILDIFFLNRNLGWVLYWDSRPPFASKMLKTTNGGADWDTASCPGENPFFYAVCFIDSLTGFLAGPPILKTTNGGQSWYEAYVYDVDTLPPNLSGLPVKELSFANKNIGYACGGFKDIAGVMWCTSDGGESWAAKGLYIDPFEDLHIFDSLNVSALTGDPEYRFSIMHIKSTDAGINWFINSLNVYGIPSAISFRTTSEGWAVKEDKFIVTMDSGNTWKEFPVPDSISLADIIFTDSLTGYAVGDNGKILKYKAPAITECEKNSASLPDNFFLSNYPNPFNPSTTIRYGIPGTADVNIIIYDVLGVKICSLVNETQVPGIYSIKFDGSNMANGVYFCSYQGGNYFKIIKMILLK